MPIWLAPLLGFLQPLLNRFFPDKTQQAQFQFELQKLAIDTAGKQLDADLQLALSQAKINEIEAASENIFKSGWRPFLGWCCGAAFVYDFLFRPIVQWIALLINPQAPQLINLDLAEMMPVLLGMLGLGTMRTVERLNGVIPKGQ